MKVTKICQQKYSISNNQVSNEALIMKQRIQVETTLPNIGCKINLLVASLIHGYHVNGITVMANFKFQYQYV